MKRFTLEDSFVLPLLRSPKGIQTTALQLKIVDTNQKTGVNPGTSQAVCHQSFETSPTRPPIPRNEHLQRQHLVPSKTREIDSGARLINAELRRTSKWAP